MTSRRGIITKGGRSNRRVRLDMSQVEGWERILDSQKTRVERAANEIEMDNARQLAREAKRLAPRSSGRRSPASRSYGPLRSKIKAEEFKGDAKVGIGTAFYGFFQERGTSRMSANPFMGPAIKKQRKPFQQDARDLVEKLLRRTGL